MFDIAFILNEPPYLDEDGRQGLWGRIVLGDFSERFVAPTRWWSRVEYERQWVDGANRLLAGARESAFVEQAGRTWWIAWRESESVFVQQRLLVADEMAPARLAVVSELPYELVGDRETHSEDGSPISQWLVGVDDVRAFVERRAKGLG